MTFVEPLSAHAASVCVYTIVQAWRQMIRTQLEAPNARHPAWHLLLHLSLPRPVVNVIIGEIVLPSTKLMALDCYNHLLLFKVAICIEESVVSAMRSMNER